MFTRKVKAPVDHYMVEFEDDGTVCFANKTDMHSIGAAQALARKTSAKYGSAYVVAFNPAISPVGTFEAVGHIEYFDGVMGGKAGVLE